VILNRVFAGLLFVFLLTGFSLLPARPAFAEMHDYPIVKLRSLDKIAARTMTFQAAVGSTIKFGTIYIKIQSCRKSDPIDQPESAAFLQIWEVAPKADARWIFSGWMFASSPALSAMDHPIYDVWVIDCLDKEKPGDKTEEKPKDKTPVEEPDAAPGEIE
jgi:hypothetical protein